MFFRSLVPAAVFAIHASAMDFREAAELYLATRDDSPTGHQPIIMSRQEDAVTAEFTLVENAPSNLTQWGEVTNEACIAALAKLDVSTNPSGTCVCYNLPALDTNTGVFEADLRLYKISDARDQFSGIAPENIAVGLTYSGASVSQETTSAGLNTRTVGGLRKRSDPQLLQTYMFVGQIDQAQMEAISPMSMAAIEALVIPVVTLTGTNSGGETVSTNVSMNEAAFVSGVFSNQVVLSSTAIAQLELDMVKAQLANGTTPFVVPGVRIMIFPIPSLSPRYGLPPSSPSSATAPSSA